MAQMVSPFQNVEALGVAKSKLTNAELVDQEAYKIAAKKLIAGQVKGDDVLSRLYREPRLKIPKRDKDALQRSLALNSSSLNNIPAQQAFISSGVLGLQGVGMGLQRHGIGAYFNTKRLTLLYGVGNRFYEFGKSSLRDALKEARLADPGKYSAMQAAIAYNRFIRAAKIAARTSGSNAEQINEEKKRIAAKKRQFAQTLGVGSAMIRYKTDNQQTAIQSYQTAAKAGADKMNKKMLAKIQDRFNLLQNGVQLPQQAQVPGNEQIINENPIMGQGGGGGQANFQINQEEEDEDFQEEQKQQQQQQSQKKVGRPKYMKTDEFVKFLVSQNLISNSNKFGLNKQQIQEIQQLAQQKIRKSQFSKLATNLAKSWNSLKDLIDL